MAQTKIANRQISGGLDGWIPIDNFGNYTFTLSSTSGVQSTVEWNDSMNLLSYIGKGWKITWTQNSTVRNAYVINADANAGITDTETIFAGDLVLDTTTYPVTDIRLSMLETPSGFPHYFGYTPTISVSGGTAPSYATNDCVFAIRGGWVHVRIALANSSGGTAGAGTNPIVITLPTDALVNTSFLGSGVYYHAVPAFAEISARLFGTNTFYMHTYALDNIIGTSQANANRYIYLNLTYPLA